MTAVQHEYGVPAVWQPKDALEAWKLKQTFGEAAIYTAGSTLLRTQWEAGTAKMPEHLIDLGRVSVLRGVQYQQSEIVVGAMTPLGELRRDAKIREHFPLLTEAVRSIAAPSIRNLATLGGNLGSLVGDSIPALLAYEAELIWFDGERPVAERTEDWLERIAMDLRNGSDRLLMQIRLPLDAGNRQATDDVSTGSIAFYQKVGRREAFTPSVVTVAMNALLDEDSRFIKAVLAAGGGQTRPVRLYRTESLLAGRELTVELLSELYAAVMAEYAPKGDLFASEEYRRTTAANVIAAELWTVRNKLITKEG